MLRAAGLVAGPASAGAAARRRNAQGGGRARRARWAPARDALWAVLDERLAPGAAVAIVGAGNGDDVPLARIAERAGRLALIDLDGDALRRARRTVPRRRRGRVELVEHDVTGGAADTVLRGADLPAIPTGPLPGAPYDLVVGDLLYSQLLFPALEDARVERERARTTLATHGPPLTAAVVARLHASAPGGIAVHVHDPLGWWEGHDQPFAVDAVLGAPPDAAERLIARGHGPLGCDPRPAVTAGGGRIVATACWRWPFRPGVDYLVRATVAVIPPAPSSATAT